MLGIGKPKSLAQRPNLVLSGPAGVLPGRPKPLCVHPVGNDDDRIRWSAEIAHQEVSPVGRARHDDIRVGDDPALQGAKDPERGRPRGQEAVVDHLGRQAPLKVEDERDAPSARDDVSDERPLVEMAVDEMRPHAATDPQRESREGCVHRELMEG